MFIGASTGRAGSVWIASVFNKLGFACTHEFFFNARKQPFAWPQVKGEWSAQAVPVLGDYDVPVFHQVRHPLDVVGSYLERGWFGPTELGPENAYMVEHGGIDRKGDPHRELARFYVEWNMLIEEHAGLRWQVEQFDDFWATQVSWRLKLPTRRPMSAVVADRNESERPTVEWTDIPEPERSALKSIADRYGY